MLILEMNRAGMVNRGLTGYATGFSIGAVQTAAASYKETGKIDWEVDWKGYPNRLLYKKINYATTKQNSYFSSF